MITDPDFVARQCYWWENTTILIPDVQAKKWKRLKYIDEVDEKNCVFAPERCPQVSAFVKHHMVERSIPKDTRIETMAGNDLWWSQVGEDFCLFPEGINVLRKEAFNGDLRSEIRKYSSYEAAVT